MQSRQDEPERAAPDHARRAMAAPAVDRALAGRARPSGAQTVLELQRSSGNAAVARMLDARPRLRPATASIQRDEKSAGLLTKLATPQVAEGPSVAVQVSLVEKVEQLLLELKGENAPSEINLGGILIDSLPGADKSYERTATGKEERKEQLDQHYERLTAVSDEKDKGVKFVGLDNLTGGRSAGIAFGPEVKKAGFGPLVLENTLKTMLDAQQIEYLRLAGMPNAEWKIVVELHYIRSRPKDMAGFHKDTKGQSLFVNLNYHVPGHEVRGPEYVRNPPPSPSHDEQIFGTGDKTGSLPKPFTDDLLETRKQLGEPEEIKSAGTIQGTGYVAFVDEAIHHATPWFGGRYVTPTEFKDYLARTYKAEFDEIIRADKAKSSSMVGSFYSLESYVDKKVIPEKDQPKWVKWLSMTGAGETKESKGDGGSGYTRKDIPDMEDKDFDLMLQDVGAQEGAARQKGGAGGWHSASIPSHGLSPIQSKERPPLIRQSSQSNFEGTLPKQLPEDVPRRFIRSWVRAVPKTLAERLRQT
jgi:hypothetical protein